MNRRSLAAGLLLTAMIAAPMAGKQGEKAQVAKTTLKVGDPAPDFTLLSSQDWKPVKLSDFRGKKNVFLAIYVLAFTGG
jgi:AhpC/TSA family